MSAKPALDTVDIDALQLEAERLDAADAAASTPGGRSPNEEQAAAPTVSSAELLRDLLPSVASFFRPPLTREETDLLAERAGVVIDKWFPDGGVIKFISSWREEIALILTLKAIFEPRFLKAKAAQAADQADASQPPVVISKGNE